METRIDVSDWKVRMMESPGVETARVRDLGLPPIEATHFPPDIALHKVSALPKPWSQNLFLEADVTAGGREGVNGGPLLWSIHENLMRSFLGREGGFQAPCEVAHMSLRYAEGEAEESPDAIENRRKWVQDWMAKNGIGVDVGKYRLGTVELWLTGGGYDQIPLWRKVDEVKLY